MIDKIRLKSSSSLGQSQSEFELTPITVFVGPNNSGKSKVLIEIENYSRHTHGQKTDVILDSIFFSSLSQEEIENELNIVELQPTPEENVPPEHILIGKLTSQKNKVEKSIVHKEGLINEAQNPNQSLGNYSRFLSLYTLRLDGTSRLNLIHQQQAGDLQNTPTNHLTYLFINDELRKNVRRIIYEAFEKFYVIDPTHIGQFRVRLANREPKTIREEKGWEQESIDYHKSAALISEASDGVKAFTGIITTLMAGDPKITLIDEPEAFLHPGLSNKLGKEIGVSLNNSNKRLFVSTHSSSFLMGCIQSGSPLNIIRLTYKKGLATSRILPKEKILHLMRNPLLRSTGILNGLFYEAVIVTEADSDRAFYQEINERLLSVKDPRGINNVLFINAQNKQTVWEIVKPLRDLGIPAAGIVDIDVLKEGGSVFNKLLDGSFVPVLNKQAYANQRKTLYDAFKKTGKNWKIEGGVDLLVGDENEACNNFFNQMEEYGVFMVRKGELESWLKTTGASGHGPKWLIDIFSRMGDNPSDQGYLKPQDGDVWSFIGDVKSWIDNSERKGIPS